MAKSDGSGNTTKERLPPPSPASRNDVLALPFCSVTTTVTLGRIWFKSGKISNLAFFACYLSQNGSKSDGGGNSTLLEAGVGVAGFWGAE